SYDSKGIGGVLRSGYYKDWFCYIRCQCTCAVICERWRCNCYRSAIGCYIWKCEFTFKGREGGLEFSSKNEWSCWFNERSSTNVGQHTYENYGYEKDNTWITYVREICCSSWWGLQSSIWTL